MNRMDSMNYARMAAPALEGYGIYNLERYVGDAKTWGHEIWKELVCKDGLKETYQKFAIEICEHAHIAHNPDYVVRVLSLMACSQWILKRALLRTLPSASASSTATAKGTGSSGSRQASTKRASTSRSGTSKVEVASGKLP